MIRKSFLAAGLSLSCYPVFADSVQPLGGGGIERGDLRDHITPLQRQAIEKKLVANRLLLLKSLSLSVREQATQKIAQPLFDWPTQSTSNDPGYFGIANFLDHNAAFPDLLEDYNCGTRTYDTDSGYNHKGIDIYSWPFPWLKMDNNEVEIIAAEPGIIIGKDDGNFDRNCGFEGSWNAVYVEHADGSVAWYGHLKKNSLTAKTVGQSIQTGDYLGVMGSSGNSTGPHLHIEVYDADSNLVDPSEGACNSFTDNSWWSNQRPYYESGILLVATHDAPPISDNGCGVTETPNFKQDFVGGQMVYFAVYLRDQQAGQQLEMKIVQPDGSTWYQWVYSMDSPAHYSSSSWYWNLNLPAKPQAGIWKWQLQFEGQQTESLFTVSTEIFTDGFEGGGK